MIQICIVNSECLVSDLLTRVLDTQDDMTVVGQASTPTAALEALYTQPCDVLLLDLLLDDQGASRLIAQVERKFPDIQCLVVGLFDSVAVPTRCLELGAAGYLDGNDSLDTLVAKVRSAACGEALISPKFAGELIARLVKFKWMATGTNGYQSGSLQEQAQMLTMREQEVFALIGQKQTNNQIAKELLISVGTVKNHVHHILDKLDVHTRRQAVMVSQQLEAGCFSVPKGN